MVLAKDKIAQMVSFMVTSNEWCGGDGLDVMRETLCTRDRCLYIVSDLLPETMIPN